MRTCVVRSIFLPSITSGCACGCAGVLIEALWYSLLTHWRGRILFFRMNSRTHTHTFRHMYCTTVHVNSNLRHHSLIRFFVLPTNSSCTGTLSASLVVNRIPKQTVLRALFSTSTESSATSVEHRLYYKLMITCPKKRLKILETPLKRLETLEAGTKIPR